MASFYEMSLENEMEYVICEHNRVHECTFGTWIIEFIDVDWDGIQDHFLSMYHARHSKLPVSKQLAIFVNLLYESMMPRHPLLYMFFHEELRYITAAAFNDFEPFSKEEKIYRDKFGLERDLPGIRIDLTVNLLKALMHKINELKEMKEFVLHVLDTVMVQPEDGADQSVIQRYFEFKRRDFEHMTKSYALYSQMVPTFHFSIGNKVYDYTSAEHIPESENTFKTGKLLEAGRMYMLTDDLTALTLWELDMLCSHNIRMRKCQHCGRWFIPSTITNCYCSRPLADHPEKTCKEIGAATQYQKSIEKDAAKILFTKFRNRVQTYRSRHIEDNKDYDRYYKVWQLQAKDLKAKVAEGLMSYEEFEAIIDRPSNEIFKMKGQIPNACQ